MAKIELTDEQRNVVENRGGALLVAAAAGSGKTRVLVDRIFRYVLEERRDLDEFLMITYTKAAAAEMRGKIAKELSERLAEDPGNSHLRAQSLRLYRADIRTIDSFCTNLLREYAYLVRFEGDERLSPDFRILDEAEAAVLREQCLERVLDGFYEELDEGGRALADSLGAGRDDRKLSALVLEVYAKLQSHAEPGKWLARQEAFWADPSGAFDETDYARVLLDDIRRTAAHLAQLLLSAAERTVGDEKLERGFGEPFSAAAASLARLAEAEDWEAARVKCDAVVFPRLNTPRGRKDEPEIVNMRALWDLAKTRCKKRFEPLAVSGAEAMEDFAVMAPSMRALLGLLKRFISAYSREKRRLNAADCADQEHLALRLLVDEKGEPTELGRSVSERFCEILVDEYQDTNEVQNAIFRAVSRNGQNLFTVGDVKQSIYRFRLADPTIFLDRYRRYAPAENARDGEPRKILLTRNFRSRREVLDATNRVFRNILSEEMGEMEYGDDESLHFGATYYPERSDAEVEFHLLDVKARRGENKDGLRPAEAEAAFVAERVAALLKSQYPVSEGAGFRPCRSEDIVILLRSPASRAAAFAAALREKNIPCAWDVDTDFFTLPEIMAALSALRCLDNPHQDIPLISLLRTPGFAFSNDELARIRARTPKGDFYEALAAYGSEESCAFLKELDELREEARLVSVERLLWRIYDRWGLMAAFGAQEGGEERRENLIAFARLAAAHEKNGHRGLFSFLHDLEDRIALQKAPEITRAARGGVRIMSIHRSKGLEFPIVILADLSHGFSTQDYRSPVLVHPALGLGPVRIDPERRIRYDSMASLAIAAQLRRENLSEEMRVLYVGMTRAQEKLILVDAFTDTASKLKKLAAETNVPVPPESVAKAGSYSDWLLSLLLCAPEGEPLRALAQCGVLPLDAADPKPWRVQVHGAEEETAAEEHTQDGKAGEVEIAEPIAFDPALLSWQYPCEAFTRIPAKQTATAWKGRILDEELDEDAPSASERSTRALRQPEFRKTSHGLSAAEQGTATHLLLQYLDFSGGSVSSQLADLVKDGYLTEQQAAAVNASNVERLLASPIADEIRAAETVYREYPFSILVDASEADPALPGGEEILLQGVVDCFFETEEGLVVVDFKTDHIRDDSALRARVRHYEPQLAAYSLALGRIFEKKIARRVLYFLSTGTAVEVTPGAGRA